MAASCVVFWILTTQHLLGGITKTLAIGVLTTLACVEKLCSVMNLIAVERDWVFYLAALFIPRRTKELATGRSDCWRS